MKNWCKFVQKSIKKNRVLDGLGGSGGALGAILAFQSNLAREKQFFGPPGPSKLGPNLRPKIFILCLKIILRRPGRAPGGDLKGC